MDRREIVLSVLAASNGAIHTPVQVQKLFFLIDRKVPAETGGPHFNFAPRDYGPFDVAVYRQLEDLESERLVEITRSKDLRWKTYRTTPEGQQQGERMLNALPSQTQGYIRGLSHWVRRQSFVELVSAIYREYPEMKVKSIFGIKQ